LEEQNEMKEFLMALMEVKETLARMDQKVDNLSEIKSTSSEAHRIASEADARSKNNEKDISEIKQNDQKKWIAIGTVTSGFLLQVVYFVMTK
jgi:predicted metal-dependent hydrolase